MKAQIFHKKGKYLNNTFGKNISRIFPYDFSCSLGDFSLSDLKAVFSTVQKAVFSKLEDAKLKLKNSSNSVVSNLSKGD